MKTTTKRTKKPAPEPQPTIGQYLDRRLNSMACNGDFGGPGALRPYAVALELVHEYMKKFDGVRYE